MTKPKEKEPRRDLVAHVREQIEADPEGYANAAKFRAIAHRIWAASAGLHLDPEDRP